ncbi:MAG TPA: hypothetical protein VGM18_21640 [Candidatus Sulfotelmatobacter sp.]|jgi:hypothetical protein
MSGRPAGAEARSDLTPLRGPEGPLFHVRPLSYVIAVSSAELRVVGSADERF